ncbi:hypothetical protein LC565_09090 [Fusobacterium animalis]|jgi:hypothetical protein|uniref:hypothetical protein n=1 Tax=Fusobacterium animalis TaxID=76859 RepID=UPI0030D4E923
MFKNKCFDKKFCSDEKNDNEEESLNQIGMEGCLPDIDNNQADCNNSEVKDKENK